MSASKEKSNLHENLRREQARLIDLENFKIAKKLQNVQGTLNINRNNLESSFSRHQRAKAILCKLPIVDMKQNCFSGGATAMNRGQPLTSRGSNPNYSQDKRQSPRATTRRHRHQMKAVNRSLVESNAKKQPSEAIQSYDAIGKKSKERQNQGKCSTQQAGRNGKRGRNKRRSKQNKTVRNTAGRKDGAVLPQIISPVDQSQLLNNSQLSIDTLQNIKNDSKIDNEASILVDEQASNEAKALAEVSHPYANVASSLPAINQTPSLQHPANPKRAHKKRH